MKSILKNITVAVKGACMGAADVIPGVSGGTIAFIMGIYDEFVSSLASINTEAVKLLMSGKFKAFWKHINGSFLLSLFIGIGISVVSLAGLMQYLLSSHPIRTWAFFFGLITASSIFILRGISDWRAKEICFLAFGIVLGTVICTLSPTRTPDGLWFIFISGAIAICAMILPGISGSFILLILGKYQYIMSAISGFVSGEATAHNLLILGTFCIGAAIGLLSFSRFLHWLLAKYNKETLIVLAGFIIGSLVKVWPWSNTEAIVCSQFPEIARMAENAAALSGPEAEAARNALDMAVSEYAKLADPQTGSAVLFAIAGFLLVTIIEAAGKWATKNKAAKA